MIMGRNTEARNIILKLAKRNGVVLSNDTLSKFEMASMAEENLVSSTAAYLSPWCSPFCTHSPTPESRVISIF
jgi:hypothetical protein